jgi:heme/copper-type cytochrome/quinol oxidase subunit 2
LQDFGFHTDCMPGKLIMHLISCISSGISIITCQELCGYGHAGMTLGISIE